MAGFEGKNIIAVSAGYTHFIALSKDGYVYSWGANSYGQLGNNTTSNVTSLSGVTQVVGQSGENYLYDIVKIAANGNSSAAVRSDGTLWTWGANKSSQLGDGTSTNKTTPIQVIRGESNPEYDNREDNSNYYVYLQNVKDVSVGEDHMIAMTEDGSVYTWGSNKYGQLGVNIDGDSVNHAVKVDTSAITAVTDENGNADEITAVYAGKHYSAIITREGHMYVSGRNTDDTEGTNYVTGKLGTGTTDESISEFTSVATGLKYEKDNNIENIHGVRNVALGANHTVIISKYGYVWSWGANNNYQLGDITYNVRIEKGSTTYNINTVPTISGNRETRYMTINDAVTDKGRIIASSDDNISMPPVVTISEDDVLNITKVTYDYSSGFNVAETDEHPVMYLANDPNTYSNVTWASSDENVATIENGKIIPNDNRRYSSTTISVQNMNGAIGMFILKIKRNENTVAVPMVAAGDDFSIALRADGTVWSWGNNDKGQLGLGSSVTNQDRPVQIKNLSNITYITAGQYHAGAIDKDGNVYMWGYNEFGQMGNGTSNNYNLTHHKDDHYYYDDSCWSPDSHHNHGGSSGHTHYMYNKVNNNAYTPVKLSYNFGEKIETITAGDNHTVVMTESGKVYAWGDNRYNQIGSPQTYAKSGYMGHYRYNLCSGNSNDAEITRVPLMLTPVRVRGAEGYGYLEEIIDVRAGGDFTIALKRDGTAYTWG